MGDISLLFFVLGFAAFCFMGGVYLGVTETNKDAVKAGVGEYIIVNTDETKFQWKKCPGVE